MGWPPMFAEPFVGATTLTKTSGPLVPEGPGEGCDVSDPVHVAVWPWLPLFDVQVAVVVLLLVMVQEAAVLPLPAVPVIEHVKSVIAPEPSGGAADVPANPVWLGPVVTPLTSRSPLVLFAGTLKS